MWRAKDQMCRKKACWDAFIKEMNAKPLAI